MTELINVDQAIEALEADLTRRDATVKAIETLREVRSAQGHLDSVRKQADKAASDRDAAQAQLTAALEGVSKAGEEGKAIIAAAQEQAGNITDQAQHNAADILAKAKKDGEQATADLKDAATKSLAVVTAERDGLARKNGELKAEAADLAGKRDVVAAELAEKSAALESVKAAIAALRG